MFAALPRLILHLITHLHGILPECPSPSLGHFNMFGQFRIALCYQVKPVPNAGAAQQPPLNHSRMLQADELHIGPPQTRFLGFRGARQPYSTTAHACGAWRCGSQVLYLNCGVPVPNDCLALGVNIPGQNVPLCTQLYSSSVLKQPGSRPFRTGESDAATYK